LCPHRLVNAAKDVDAEENVSGAVEGGVKKSELGTGLRRLDKGSSAGKMGSPSQLLVLGTIISLDWEDVRLGSKAK